VLDPFFKRTHAVGAQRILQRCKRKANKDRDARGGENTLSFQNYKKQMKKAYVIYADFEALVIEIPARQIKYGKWVFFKIFLFLNSARSKTFECHYLRVGEIK